jgi:hypothetical protein
MYFSVWKEMTNLGGYEDISLYSPLKINEWNKKPAWNR